MFEVGYKKASVLCVCGFIFFLDILINVDHGALPSASVVLKDDLNLSNVQFGSLGSLVFLGLVMGSVCATFMLNLFTFKTILMFSFLGNGIGLLLFTATREFYLMGLARFMSGFFQIFLTIYIPLYADQFGTPTSKPLMMSLILVAGPIGVVTGYGLTGIVVSYGYDWRISFVV